MTAAEFILRALVSWLVISTIVVGAYALAMALRNARRERTQRITPAYPQCVPVRPPVTQAEVDAAWLDAWADVERSDIDDMEQTVFDRLFADQIAAEGLQ